MPSADHPPAETPASRARAVMRAADRAALATAQAGWPFASLVLVALDHDASPLLLISDLSEHAKNIKADPRVSLLFDGTQGLDDPLTGPRVTLLGEARPVDDKRLKGRFLARHPSAELYAGFADFHLHRVAVTRAHLVAGFGRIHWVEARELVVTPDGSFGREEPAILAAINADPKMVNAAVRALGLEGDGWRVTGIDPEGLDLRRAGSIARLALAFANADAVRSALIHGEFPRF
jgi:heme oxygenase (biliverdin-IX-beta and delta-forming)